MAGPSNCLLLQMAEAPGEAAALQHRLEEFGDVQRAEPLEGGPALRVSYFDARCALRAKEALGEACRFAAQDGRRSLRLGRAALEAASLDDVSNVTCTAAGDFEVEFFDTRVVARLAAPAGPRKVNSLRLSALNWTELAAGRERRRQLRLLYLPAALCEERAFLRLLERLGLGAEVERLSVAPARPGRLGSARVCCRSAEGVRAFARLLHGRQLGASTPLSVCFDEGRGRGEPLRVEERKPYVEDKEKRADSCGSTAPGSSRESSDDEASPRV